jgi:ABC-type nitrate/sulfonate/bicarbonate transport system substrate-binding protein
LLLLFTDSFIQQHRDTAIKFLAGYLTAIKAIHSDPKKALADWAEETTIAEIRMLKAPGTLPDDGKVYLDALKFEAGLAYRFGYLKQPIDAPKTIDNSLIEAAAARLLH